MAPSKESKKPEKIYLVMSDAKQRKGRGKVRKPLPDAPRSKPSEPRPASTSSSGITEVEGKKNIDSPSATDSPPRRSPRLTRSPEDDPSPSDYVQNDQTNGPQRLPPCTTKSPEDDPKPSDSVENNQTFERREQAQAPPRTNPTLPGQPSALPFQAAAIPFTPPTIPFQAIAVQFQPPTILYGIPPAPPYPAAPNRHLNPSEVSAAQNSISQLQDNERLKGMLESFQAAARSIQWNAEQLDRMIASVLGSLPQPE